MKSSVESLIKQGRTERALQLLSKDLQDGDLKQEASLLESRWENLQRQIRGNDITFEKADIETNRINAAILDLSRKSDAPKVRLQRRVLFSLVMLFAIFGLFFLYRKWSDTFSFTVYVLGEKGPHDKPLLSKGKVILHTDYDHTEEINSRGEVTFNGIPASFRNKPVMLNLAKDLNVPYEALKPDSLYKIGDSKSIQLIVRLSGLELIRGQVRNEDNLPLSSVKISLTKDVSTQTDEDGRFELRIPSSLQKEEITLTAYKIGFSLLDFNVYPQTGAEAKIIMKRH